jgi:hypothetical protein
MQRLIKTFSISLLSQSMHTEGGVETHTPCISLLGVRIPEMRNLWSHPRHSRFPGYVTSLEIKAKALHLVLILMLIRLPW